MLKSMTGYARAFRTEGNRSVTVEMKAENGRYLDIAFSLPKSLTYLEEPLKRMIAERVQRGKVRVGIAVEGMALAETVLEMDWALLDQYLSALASAARRYGLSNELTAGDLVRLPDVFKIKEREKPLEEVEPLITETLSEALDALCAMRLEEGRHIEKDMRLRLDALKRQIEAIRDRVPQAVQAHREKMEQRVRDFLNGRVDIDETRLLNEVAVFVDKSDITEELTRLDSHIRQFLRFLDEEEPKGRKLDFLVQEMNREINTIGAKSNDEGIALAVVMAKSELEKIREQAQNIE
ncbi:YicC/YloC family endoribonuclease [Caenibacillus caldisaponilyticus]|uniref:YicC/YloC family endoribonuclease n=1 Tax=Caenibacillus caldisaponilyticus TaxID=1674942 RepID=UPI000988801D|nr:YicC/YloC family endoribonuclease [Caenibacillus caldisaponilyticus]